MPSPSDPATDGQQPLIEVVGLGRGRRGFEEIRVNREARDDVSLQFDLHSEIRVRVGERVYDESDAHISVVDA